MRRMMGTIEGAVGRAGGLGRLFSGLNMPVSDKVSMVRESNFIGQKQPWGGLLAVEEARFRK